MARILLLAQVALGFLLIAAVLAEETATTLEDEATTTTQNVNGLNSGNQTESTTDQPTDSTTVTAATELIDLMTYTPEGAEHEENGGYPFVSPRGSKHHLKQVRAHDGFHNIKHEPLWAHWNDVFSTTSRT